MSAYAAEGEAGASIEKKRSVVLRNALRKLKASSSRADTFLDESGIREKPLDLRGLPEGELLIFEIVLRDEPVRFENTVSAEIASGTVVFSMRDLLTALDFPIEYDAQTGGFEGWFIREDKRFSLDNASGLVVADGTEFRLSKEFVRKDDDLLVALADVEQWFGLELDTNIANQLVRLDADPPLPAMERISRRRFQKRVAGRGPAVLPRGDDAYDLIDFPLIDVSTNSTYVDPANGESDTRHNFNVRTANEFAYGTLRTNFAGDAENNLTSAQVSYLQESNAPELLGPLKARRFELGDVLPTFSPITGNASVETGARITNTNPLIRQRLPRTQISGSIFPGWDVELYRGGSLLAFVETDENGFYLFDNVDLFSNENAFRVVAYGPQGEVREENISIPLDRDRDARGEIIYDASLTFQDTQTFRRFEPADNPDEGLPHFVGFVEAPITDNAALLFGARYRQEEGEDKTYLNTGIATTIAGTLVNADVATDEDGALGSELVVSRRFGPHAVRSEFSANTDDFDPGQNSSVVDVLEGNIVFEGPLSFGFGDSPRYSASANYSEDADGVSAVNGLLNYNTRFANLGFSQTLDYFDVSDNPTDAEIGGTTSLSGSFGKNFIRTLATYSYEPDAELDSLTASWRRRINPELESTLEVSQDIESDLTRYSAFVNWRPDWATITPSITVDSDSNVTGGLSTRFGITRVPESGDFIFSRQFTTTNGAINAFVYLDKNGNEIFDGDDEPIRDARVQTPQNGSGVDTNEDGIAFVSRLIPGIITDVFVEPGSLEDPFWVPAREGVSILPRTGTNNKVEIPIHVAGEIDGTVYARNSDGSAQALRSIQLHLYDEDGKLAKTTRAGNDGFYIFDLVSPGTYSLLVGSSGLPRDVSRPKPQIIQIGFDGTTIFGNDIFLEAGARDIPAEIVADMEDFKAYHPHIDFSASDYNVVLNLGEYNSRLLTSVVWYRLQSRYNAVFKAAELYVPPSKSFATPKTGKHTLRVGLKSQSVDDAYNRCRALVARDVACTVEIHPNAQKQAFVQNAKSIVQ